MAATSPAQLLDEIVHFLKRFVSYPNDADAFAHALWIAHTHIMEAWDSTPRLAFLSPEPGSGKTRALEVTELLVPRPIESINVSPAYLFRKVGDPDGTPTILFDEIDTVFGPKARDNEELRGLLNAGHRRGATAGRCVVKGKEIETEELPAYCAVAMAGLGKLPDTILSRSIVVKMKRRALHETVEPFRRRIHSPDGHTLRDRLELWCESIGGTIMNPPPKMPIQITDRNADVWEPLIAVADAAGGRWPELARDAAVAHVAHIKEESPSLGVSLLADIKMSFRGDIRLPSRTLVARLNSMPEAPWAELDNKPLNQRRLAQLLKQYDISPKGIRVEGLTPRGYERSDFCDAWNRYLPPSR
ncbi:DUF3631 domain-containing protein [Hyphobacterium sp. HN65]|uniref:DUF3631 domain-containing protein n=1 Tax=Hyphobacterium lacteum TaxID=3116575 RepID=A0ABU7LRG8_9PROT|nr:DUF3631 domain-containing protein [Hyphobacterium sp. HN65]MEE2526498.1 DUF3631 domain-containing protein [Hyphobacterium sp. HN65]